MSEASDARMAHSRSAIEPRSVRNHKPSCTSRRRNSTLVIVTQVGPPKHACSKHSVFPSRIEGTSNQGPKNVRAERVRSRGRLCSSMSWKSQAARLISGHRCSGGTKRSNNVGSPVSSLVAI